MYLYLAIALIAAVLSGIGVWKVSDWRNDSKEKDRIEAAAEKARFDRRTVDIAATGHEADKVQIRTVTKIVNRDVERIVREKFYLDGACFDADGLLAITQAAGRATAASEPSRKVP